MSSRKQKLNSRSKRNRSEHYAATKQWDKIFNLSSRQERRAQAALERRNKKHGQEKSTEK